jgi:hypothetical protein
MAMRPYRPSLRPEGIGHIRASVDLGVSTDVWKPNEAPFPLSQKIRHGYQKDRRLISQQDAEGPSDEPQVLYLPASCI